MFLFHVDISENGFYTIFWKFNRSLTKLEDADKIRIIDGIRYNIITKYHNKLVSDTKLIIQLWM